MILGPPNDCSMITFRPTRDTTRQQTKEKRITRARKRKQTFWSKRNTDSVCKHVDAFEDACAALVRKLNFLVSAAGENGAGSLRRSTAERARRAGGDVVHDVECAEVGEKREERWTVRRKWVGRKGRKERNTRQSGPSCLSLYLAYTYVILKK